MKVLPDPVALRDISATVIEAAMLSLTPYVIGFCRMVDTPHGVVPHLIGSGTLIQAKGRRAVLTAHHVLTALPTSGRLGVMLNPGQGSLTIDTGAISYHPIAKGRVDADGPDIGLIRLSTDVAGSFAAKKLFYNLEAVRDEMLHTPPPRDHGFWIANGFPAAFAESVVDDEGPVIRFMNMSGVGGPDEPATRGEFDYYRFPVSPEGRSRVPDTFGGMSGGGLWQVRLRSTDGVLAPLPPLLSGVVYYEVQEEDDCAILCHGRKSIYEVAYAHL